MRKRGEKSGRARIVSADAILRARRSGNSLWIARLALADEGGQVLPWVVVMMLTVLGISALVVDCGRAMVVQRELQASADSAALAAAQMISGTSTTYQSYATTYSSASSDKNAYTGLTLSGSPTVTPLCLTTVVGWGIPCTTSGGKVTIPNAVSVTETASVTTLFAGILGQPTVNLSATSTATKGRPNPYNIALIVDSTLSMNQTDANCNNVTSEQCALNGVQQLLSGLDTNYDHVALFTFPNVVVGSNAPAGVAITTSGASTTFNCTSTVPSSQNSIAYYNYSGFYTPVLNNINTSSGNDSNGNFTNNGEQKHYQPPYTGIAWAMPYTFPPIPTSTSGYTIPTGADAPSYQVTPFVEDYNTTSNGTTSINSNSVLVQAAGGESGCGGIVPSSYDGDFGTYYPGAIYAAQAALLKEQANHANSSNVMIVLGDGNATSPQTWGPEYSMPDTAAHAEYTYSASQSLANGYTYPSSYLTATSGGTYPSWIGECGQAVDAAQYAATYTSGGTANNTLIFTIAYGAPTTSSTANCASDRSGGTHKDITPCQTLQQMATQVSGYTVSPYFYSDWAAQGGSQSSGCQANSANSGTVAISDIYEAIVTALTSARLIPNGTT
jgi:hypothetical protein